MCRPSVFRDGIGENRPECRVASNARVKPIYQRCYGRLRDLSTERGHRKITTAQKTTTRFQNSMSIRVRIIIRSSSAVAPMRSATKFPGKKKTFRANFMVGPKVYRQYILIAWRAKSNIENPYYRRKSPWLDRQIGKASCG